MHQRVSFPVIKHLAILAACLLLICSGCRKSEPATALSWPGGWPVPLLTVQPGMQQAELFASLGFDSDDGGYTVQGKPGVGDFDGELWAVGFATQDSFANVLKYWEAELRNAGYYVVENDVESASTRAAARQYISPDKRILIVVAHSADKSRESGLTRAVIKLSVCTEDIPLGEMLRRL